MLRWNSFPRSVGFAALAALAFPALVAFLGPVIGTGPLTRGSLLGLAAVYVAGLVSDPRVRRRRLFAGSTLALGLALLPLSLPATAALVVFGVAVGRTGLTSQRPRARAWVIESCLALGGIGLAAFLFAPGAAGLALAIWGFFLVQSAYFLVGGRSEHPPAAETDRFEHASRQLERMLAETPDEVPVS